MKPKESITGRELYDQMLTKQTAKLRAGVILTLIGVALLAALGIYTIYQN